MTAETRRFAVDFLPGLPDQPGDDSSFATAERLAAIRLGEAVRVLLERVANPVSPPVRVFAERDGARP
ncbi:Uncharacterised protein [Mycobacterium tuberculosis]|nr:Uncharacterised protein [Mycobacterium tuberculosis]